jgi:hypothetical protein
VSSRGIKLDRNDREYLSKIQKILFNETKRSYIRSKKEEEMIIFRSLVRLISIRYCKKSIDNSAQEIRQMKICQARCTKIGKSIRYSDLAAQNISERKYQNKQYVD